MEKKTAKKEAPVAGKKKAKPKAAFNGQIFMIFSAITAVVFLPSTVLLAVGMGPTLVVAFVELRGRQTKAVTVGAMNLAGCTPFLLQLWYQGHTFEKAASIIADPMALTVIYMAAGVGYMIDWSVAGVVASILYQRGLARQKAIRNRQKELTERWGPEVTGALPLDEHGFPLNQAPVNKA